MRFSKLPTRAVATVVEALDEDDEFRQLIAEGLDEDQPDRASWLFLTRPAGWTDELEVLVDLATEENEQTSAVARLREAERHLESTRTALESTRSDLVTAEEQVVVLQTEVGELRSLVAAQGAALGDLEADRANVLRNLKESEKLATARLDRIRVLEDRLAAIDQPRATTSVEERSDDAVATTPVTDEETVSSVSETPVETGPAIDTAGLADSFRDAIAALEQLATAFGVAVDAVDPGGETDDISADAPADTGAVRSRTGHVDGDAYTSSAEDHRPTRRRTPVRLRRGMVEGSPAGIEQLLATPGILVLVDGYNVAMEAWPALSKSAQRDSLIQAAGRIATRSGADIHLVFDGIGDGSRPNVTTALPVRIHFSHSDVEADDVILEMVASTTRPVVVVTSDRRILDGSRRMGANVITSAQIIAFTRDGDGRRSVGGR